MSDGPGVQKVIQYIQSAISAGAMRPGMLLPNRKELADIVSVSTLTVSIAIAKLKKEGVLIGVKGQRPRVPRPPDKAGAAGRASRARSWDSVADHLKDGIVTGAFKTGAILPTRKELCGRFKTSPATLRQALRQMVEQQLVVQRGSRYVVPAAALPLGASHILFLWYSDYPVLPSHDMDLSFLRSLERECLRNSLGLEKSMISEGPGGEVVIREHGNPAPRAPRLSESCMGIVYLVNWYEGANAAVLAWLAHTGKPVSIVDWIGGWEPPPALQAKPDLQFLGTGAAKKPGFDAGRFLIGHGHRRIAFFYPHTLAWPKIRAQGMLDACQLAGAGRGLLIFAQKSVASELDFQKMFFAKYESFRPSMDSLPGIHRDFLAGVNQLMATTFLVCENATYFNFMLPLFEQALSDERITAWVGCNDEVAMMAWSFLRARGIRVPERISLIGFGNTLDAIVSGVTSYDFDFEAVAAAVLNFLLRPNLARGMRRLARPSIGGFIIERGSTAPVHPSPTSSTAAILP